MATTPNRDDHNSTWRPQNKFRLFANGNTDRLKILAASEFHLHFIEMRAPAKRGRELAISLFASGFRMRARPKNVRARTADPSAGSNGSQYPPPERMTQNELRFARAGAIREHPLCCDAHFACLTVLDAVYPSRLAAATYMNVVCSSNNRFHPSRAVSGRRRRLQTTR